MNKFQTDKFLLFGDDCDQHWTTHRQFRSPPRMSVELRSSTPTSLQPFAAYNGNPHAFSSSYRLGPGEAPINTETSTPILERSVVFADLEPPPPIFCVRDSLFQETKESDIIQTSQKEWCFPSLWTLARYSDFFAGLMGIGGEGTDVGDPMRRKIVITDQEDDFEAFASYLFRAK